MTYQHSTLDHHSLPNLTSNTFGGVRGGVLGIQSGDSLLSSACCTGKKWHNMIFTNQTFKIHFINSINFDQLWSTECLLSLLGSSASAMHQCLHCLDSKTSYHGITRWRTKCSNCSSQASELRTFAVGEVLRRLSKDSETHWLHIAKLIFTNQAIQSWPWEHDYCILPIFFNVRRTNS